MGTTILDYIVKDSYVGSGTKTFENMEGVAPTVVNFANFSEDTNLTGTVELLDGTIISFSRKFNTQSLNRYKPIKKVTITSTVDCEVTLYEKA